MTKQKSSYRISNSERAMLVVCIIVMAAFILFVSIATQGSLEFYTRLHAIVTVFTVAVLFIKNTPLLVVRLALVLGMLGAASAVFLVFAYLPYYVSHLEYLKSIQ